MEPVGLGEWFGLMLVLSIPVVNLIVLIAGACGVGKQSFVNFCRAFLLWVVIGVIAALIYGFATGAFANY